MPSERPRYSVPAAFAGRTVDVRLGGGTVTATVAGRVVARHERSAHKGSEVLVLDHFLEVLSRKPGALPGSSALAQARSGGGFTAAHERFWQRARRRLGDGAAAVLALSLLAFLAGPALPATAAEAWSAAVSAGGATVAITFDEPLDTAVTPAVARFAVTVGGDAADLASVAHTSGDNRVRACDSGRGAR